jgi:hypothetical protein
MWRRPKRSTRLIARVLALGLLAVLIPSGSAVALGFSVTNKNDGGAGSLRQAVLDANANSGPDEIFFAAGVAGTIGLVSGQINILGDTSIVGPGASLLRISGRQESRVLSIGPGATVAISGLTISDGRIVGGGGNGGGAVAGTGGAGGAASVAGTTGAAGGPGGPGSSSGGPVPPVSGAGIRNEGDLTLERAVVSHNFGIAGSAGSATAGGGLGGAGGSASANGATGGAGGKGGDGTSGPFFTGDVQGIGIYNAGSLTVLSSTISGNVANGGNGGDATATAGSGGNGGSAFGTGARGGGGGAGGDATAAAGAGGNALGAGIYNKGTLSLTNSTVSSNSAQSGSAGTAKEIAGESGENGPGVAGGTGGRGGPAGTASATAGAAGLGRGSGVFNAAGGTATLANSTFAGNGAAFGANLFAIAQVDVRSTIVSGGGGGGGNCSGPVVSLGFNLDSGGSCGFGLASDLSGTDPQLALLGEAGGATETHLIAPGSPAVDRGIGGPATDQRGLSRTNDSLGVPNAPGGDGTDIGAVELPALPPPVATQAPDAIVASSAQPRPRSSCRGRRATIEGSAQADRIKGTPGVDVIAGLGGNDRIFGLAGNDRICGGAGKDLVAGGAGKDLLDGGAGADRLIGGPGTDVLSGGAGKDTQKQ